MRICIYEGLFLLLFFFHSANSQDFTANCNLDPISITVTPAGIMSLHSAGTTSYVYISRTAVGNPSSLPAPCQRTISGGSILFNLNPTDCEPYFTVSATKFFVSWTVRGAPNIAGNVARYDENCINVTCSYDRNYNASSGPISPALQQLLIGAVNAQGGFSVSLTLFRDDAFSNQLAAGATVIVNSGIYVRAAIDTTPVVSSRFIVQIQRCWATTTNSSTSTPSYPLITDSCSADSSFIQVIRNYQPQNGTFNVSAFIWTTNSSYSIYFHCVIGVCDSLAVGANCTGPVCPSSKRRRRRDIDTDNRILSYGPIHIIPSSADFSECSQNNGGCSDVCSVENDQVVCSCPLGSTLDEDGKTCLEIREGYQEKTWVIGNDPLFIAALFMVGLTLLLSFVFFITRRKPSSVKMIDQFEN